MSSVLFLSVILFVIYTFLQLYCVARTQWVMPVFKAAVHHASTATVATAAAIIDRVRR